MLEFIPFKNSLWLCHYYNTYKFAFIVIIVLIIVYKPIELEHNFSSRYKTTNTFLGGYYFCKTYTCIHV